MNNSRVYFKNLLHTVPVQNALFEICLTFLHSKNLKLVCCLGGLNLKIALNLQQYSYCMHALLFFV